MRISKISSYVGLIAAPLLLIASTANAAPGKEACANLDLSATGGCKVLVTGGCTEKCTPVSYDLVCDNECTTTAMKDCSTTCNTDCVTKCTVDPATFDCTTDCSASADAECTTSCKGCEDENHCTTKCSAAAASQCMTKCTSTPATSTCDTKCEDICAASCTVKSETDCHVSCEKTQKGGCTQQCTDPKGALFCGGEFVDTTTVDDCISYLKTINISVDVSARGEVKCEGLSCVSSGSAKGCSAAPSNSTPFDVTAIAGLVLGAGVIVARRRRS